MTAPLVDVGRVLGGLKDFQRRSVDYVFRRLYTDQDRTRRFLLADEVGLGKTMVARGVVARAVEHLQGVGVGRIDVVYICSSLDIARQNIARLNVTDNETPMPGRITLLPKMVRDLEHRRLNFVTFTPSTSFDLKSSLGTSEERALIYVALRSVWGLPDRKGPWNLLQGGASKSFQPACDRLSRRDERGSTRLDSRLVQRYGQVLAAHQAAEIARGGEGLRQRFDALSERFAHVGASPPREVQAERTRLVGELRGLLATTCLEALEPDLIILDEFQRFRDLLDGDSDASILARDLFEWGDARVLMLSATPYKMYTLSEESAEEAHYQDFVRTYRFLSGDPGKAEALQHDLGELRRELFRYQANSESRVPELKTRIERSLRRVMCRTERLAIDETRSGMLRQVPLPATTVSPGDLRRYLALQSVSDHLDQGETIEFWKSAPYPLNFMEAYKLRDEFRDAKLDKRRRRSVAAVLRQYPDLVLDWAAYETYREIDPGNARLRHLAEDTLNTGAWRLLWLPPSLPYYAPGGSFADPALAGLTKRLVFSSWRVVPKAVGALLSYEAERRMNLAFDEHAENTVEARKRRRPLLRFTKSDGRLTGMPVLALVYPSHALAELGDPLRVSSKLSTSPAEDVLTAVAEAVRAALGGLREFTSTTAGGPPDESWYWAAPLLLDRRDARAEIDAWWNDTGLPTSWAGRDADHDPDAEAGVAEPGEGDETRWADHVNEARRLLAGEIKLGPPPADLVQLLARVAVASPAVTALRAFQRQAQANTAKERHAVRLHAARVGWAFLSLFNQPEAMAVIRAARREEPYWRRVLEYAIDGNLQAVLDEYTHVLREGLGLLDRDATTMATELGDKLVQVLALRVASVGVHDIRLEADGSGWHETSQRIRMRFALRFGDEKSDAGDERTRAGHVRDSFNSPFWPFVLVTTSVGQEGLDFHPYCHAVVHWNLPSNPVDLEQREGRVHRYKGHAVRKNLARAHAAAAWHHPDPWQAMFEAAATPGRSSDLVPYWVFTVEGGAQIERHVLAMPLSRERARLAALRRSLAAYRMVFGQARQEELLEYLVTVVPPDDLPRLARDLTIDLAPGVVT